MTLRRSVYSLAGASVATALEFAPYTSVEQYKCGSFLQGRVEDKALTYYYQAINSFIAYISNPFPHQNLLNDRALLGDVNELRESVESKYLQWFEWQKGWLIIAGFLLLLSVLFPIFYLMFRCCICICSSSKPKNTDSRFDNCKRNLLNTILVIFVFVDVFAAAAILITGQYAEYGMEELPGRLNQCVDDMNLYKRDTDLQIRKLLIDDYQTMNRSVTHHLMSAGGSVVDRVKRLTGAHAIDVLLNISKSSVDVQQLFEEIRQQVKQLNDEGVQFDVEFARLRKTATAELEQCVNGEIDMLKEMCHKAEKLLDSVQAAQFRFNSEILSDSTSNALSQIAQANISHLLGSANEQFDVMAEVIQKEIDKKIFSAQDKLKAIGDDLFVVAETISTQIRQISFDNLYALISTVSNDKESIVWKHFQYSWYFSLAITAVFVLIAFCFLFGLFYGICGRRPTYYNDDCCVRTTGSRFFSCGIWLTVMLFTVLSISAVAILLVTANVSDLVCHPLQDPLARPDVMSLAERYLDMWRSKRRSSDDFMLLLDQRTPADIIRACQRNETFYEIFEFDKKYHLNELKEFEKDSYVQLSTYLKAAMEEMPPIHPVNTVVSEENMRVLQGLSDVNISQISKTALARINEGIRELDLVAKMRAFEQTVDSAAGRPKAVSTVLEQIEEIDAQTARPLRNKLEALHANLTKLDARISELQVPISSILSKLQHAQAILADDIKQHFEQAARDELSDVVKNVDDYINHVRNQMQHEVSSCAPVATIARHSSAAFCGHAVDPLNGAWASMVISLLCLVPIVIMATIVVNLYAKMHAYPKYIVEAPQDGFHMSSFITDTYDTRHKPGYPNYSYTDDYQRTYR